MASPVAAAAAANATAALDPAAPKETPARGSPPPSDDKRRASTTPDTPPDLGARALDIIASATPGTLAATAVAFAAVAHVLLGRLGLLIIGAVGGVIALVSLEAKHPAVARAVRGEQGPEVLDRVWRDLKQQQRDGSGPALPPDLGQDDVAALNAFDDFRPDTREALGGLVDAVIRDYVKWWYSPIVPTDHSFPLACRKVLNTYLLAISNRLSRKRPADAFLDLLTNCSSIVIAFLSELAAAFAVVPPDSNMTAADAVYNYLASNPDSRLASLLNQRQQAAKFKMVAEDLLGFLDRNSHGCDPARIFLREIFANSMLEAMLQTCSKAEWINGYIVHLLEAGEPDLNQAIDVGMQTGRDTGGNNVFADMDGNVGNIGIAKPVGPSAEPERSRRREPSAHKKKLSRADEEVEERVGSDHASGLGDALGKSRSAPVEPLAMSPKRSKAGEVGTAKKAHQAPGMERWPSSKTPPGGSPADEFPGRSENQTAPLTPPQSMTASISDGGGGAQRTASSRFTSFDQIVPRAQGDAREEEEGPKKTPVVLHNASFTLHDDAPGDGSKIRNKPSWDYLIQVEPSSAACRGWMIVRRYSDFETLHEILRRIAAISGATAFMELHRELPVWRMHTRESLRGELERYLRDACWYPSLAESEGMKRFLEKSQGHSHGSSRSFGWEAVGKNMLDVLAIGPKGAVEGGKNLMVGGVSGVLGNLPGLGRKPTNQPVGPTAAANPSRLSTSGPSPAGGAGPGPGAKSPARSERTSMDSQQSSVISTQPGRMPPMDWRASQQWQAEPEGDGSRGDRADSGSTPASREHSRASSLGPLQSPSMASIDLTKLPPADDMGDEPPAGAKAGSQGGNKAGAARSPPRQFTPLSEEETRAAVDLLFAVINEMYTLSSAWNIRRTLLAAAKSFLLWPGNPSLLTVQALIQRSLLDAGTSDSGLAATLRRARASAAPTDQERAAWPPELTADDKEKLAVKARRLLIQSSVPAALMGVMGQAATGEALGRVFDCLQIEEVARGLIFGLMLRAVRIVTH